MREKHRHQTQKKEKKDCGGSERIGNHKNKMLLLLRLESTKFLFSYIHCDIF